MKKDIRIWINKKISKDIKDAPARRYHPHQNLSQNHSTDFFPSSSGQLCCVDLIVFVALTNLYLHDRQFHYSLRPLILTGFAISQ
jgi:hypothetical protein